uniref:Riorf21 protein n=1 Tax=Rhizobium rhizogenes TaxID=359 RepID=Q9F5H1_RHIRH|nr:riorf21 [Rhizobium rhizogenes]
MGSWRSKSTRSTMPLWLTLHNRRCAWRGVAWVTTDELASQEGATQSTGRRATPLSRRR